MAETLKVRVCPGCGRLLPEVNLPNEVLLFVPAIKNYDHSRVCDPCYAGLRDAVAAAVGKAKARRKQPIQE
jgi:hypothetical protein